MIELKIEKAIENFNAGIKNDSEKMTSATLARKVFPEMTDKTARVTMRRLINGDAKSVTGQTVKSICKETGVDANFLFGINKKGKK